MTKEKKVKRAPVGHTDTEKKELGEHLMRARVYAKVSVVDAAKAIGLAGKQGIDNYEKGRNVIDAIRLKKLAEKYGLTTDSLVGAKPLPAAWRFSDQLLNEVAALDQEELDFMEVAMWSQRKKKPPEQLTYRNADKRQSRNLQTPSSVSLIGNSARPQPGKISSPER